MSKKNWVETLNLPKTKFPMRAKLSKREPLFVEKWENMNIYKKIINKRKSSPLFVLHDGPPYANGRIHLGHALNKVLKDFIVKYKTMRGYQAPYVPGWDCHGLPIEKKVDEQLGSKINQMNKVDIRIECEKYARKFIDIQKEEFKRLGVFGDWDNPYLTIDRKYEYYILKYFSSFVRKGNVYRQKKPIYWCSSCKTALAEAEIEYEERKSPSIYVRFKIENFGKKFKDFKDKNAYVIIWTTTPWTLPANLAVAFHPDFEYDIFEYDNEYYVSASRLTPVITEIFGWKDYKTVKRVKGKKFEGLKAEHPIFRNKSSLFVLADYVTLDQGTGCVHTAPGHGHEDYLTGIKYGLDIYTPIDEEGKFDSTVKKYQGLHVSEANPKILEDLKKENKLLYSEQIEHSYPHCWRCKKPIVYRATKQWFISLKEGNLRDRAIEEVKKIKWIPKWGEERILKMVEERPDWCISRQRAWGVPIPAFYCEDCGETIIEENLVLKTAEIFGKEGSNSWFKEDISKFLPDDFRCPNCKSKNISKEEDILDVWFESGASHSVLDYREGHRYPSDVYIEGNDQYRGWFQSSLLVGVSAKDRAPYKINITHGWVLDEKGRAMSKSIGNVIKPQEIIEKKGAEIIRLWVAMVNYQEDLKLGQEILSGLTDAYKKIRNTWRFMLGNLNDFNPDDKFGKKYLSPVDKYILSRYKNLKKNIINAYENYQYHKIYHLIYNFFIVDLSSFYLNVKKDILYCSAPEDQERKAAQYSIFRILKGTLLLMAPILPFTTEESWSYLPEYKGKEESIHLELIEEDFENWLSSEEKNEFDRLMEIRNAVLKEVEIKRENKEVNDSLEANITIEIPEEDYNILKKYEKYFKEILVISELTIKKAEKLAIRVSKVKAKKCPRCWNYSKDIGGDKEYPDVCLRCADVVKRLNKK